MSKSKPLEEHFVRRVEVVPVREGADRARELLPIEEPRQARVVRHVALEVALREAEARAPERERTDPSPSTQPPPPSAPQALAASGLSGHRGLAVSGPGFSAQALGGLSAQ